MESAVVQKKRSVTINVSHSWELISKTYFQVKKILSALPNDKDGRIKIEDFLHTDIHSEDAFKAMDKNKDGFITKGELKLAKKNVGMNQIEGVIKQYDLDKDGKLNMEEFRQSAANKPWYAHTFVFSNGSLLCRLRAYCEVEYVSTLFK